jgi:hypothetical protein
MTDTSELRSLQVAPAGYDDDILQLQATSRSDCCASAKPGANPQTTLMLETSQRRDHCICWLRFPHRGANIRSRSNARPQEASRTSR